MGEYYVAGLPCSDELYHHGILKQRWHVRRFQNPDGSLTPAGRERYGVGKERAKRAIKNAGAKAGAAAKSAASYAAKREKMKHPSLMSDDELRNYTQRLIAEKNYSDLLRYQRSNSGLGRAKQYVTDILKRGGGTLADAAFRRLANRISKSNSEAALERLQREQAKQNIRDQLEDHERKRQIDMLTQQNRISDLQDQLADDSTSQKRELERLQRESQISNLRNQLDQNNIDMQRQINELTQQKQLKELQKALDPNKSGNAIAAAMRTISDPTATASQIKDAQSLLAAYNRGRAAVNTILSANENQPVSQQFRSTQQISRDQFVNPNIGNYDFNRDDVTTLRGRAQNQNTNPAPVPQPSPQVQNTNPNVNQPSYDFPRQYTPVDRSTISNVPQDYSNYRMNSVDGTNGGMYGGRLSDYRMNTGERQSSTYNPYADYRIPPEEEMRYGNGPRRRSMRG